MMLMKFHCLANSCIICFVDINGITLIVVRRRSNVPAFENLDTKQRTLVQGFVNNGVRAWWDDRHLVEIELPKESMVRGELGVEV